MSTYTVVIERAYSYTVEAPDAETAVDIALGTHGDPGEPDSVETLSHRCYNAKGFMPTKGGESE
jgi:hypothetical protein